MYANACTADGSDFIWQHSAPVSNASEQEFIGHQIPDMPAEMTTPTAHKGHKFKGHAAGCKSYRSCHDDDKGAVLTVKSLPVVRQEAAPF